jgi:predicted ATP-dependent endonuclease of OLD family
MYISRVHISGFRSLKNVEATLTNYSTLIGKNDSGKSSFLRALQVLFDVNSSFQSTDRCKFLSEEEPCFIEATLKECTQKLEEIDSNEITLRRTLGGKSNDWQYKGKTPKLEILKKLAKGEITKTEINSDDSLSKELKDFILDKLPSGRISKETYIEIFEEIKLYDAVEFEDGWMPFSQEKLGLLVQVVMLEADVRGEEQVTDSNRSIFSRVGSLLLHEAIKRHVGITDATENLRKEIEFVSQKDINDKWRIPEFNDFEEILSEEVKKFDSNIEAQPTLLPPKIPLVQFSVKIQIKDEWVEGIDKMGHGARRSFVFAMLRVHKRLQEKSFLQSENLESDSSPLYIFLFEEPELYLHPQAERKRMNELKELSEVENIQVILCTHSAIFVDLTEYEGILRFDRQDRKETSVKGWSGLKLGKVDEKIIKTTFRFDPSRAAMLFADLAILVEGQSEKVAIPHLAEKMRLSEELINDTFDVEIVDCGGVTNIPTYQRVLENLGIKYVAWLDSDVSSTVADVKKSFTNGNGRIVLTEDNWEKMNSIATSLGKSKPFRSWVHFVHNDSDANDKLKARVKAAYSWQDYENDPVLTKGS